MWHEMRYRRKITKDEFRIGLPNFLFKSIENAIWRVEGVKITN